MDGRTDGGDCNIPDAFLKKRGDKNTLKVETNQLCDGKRDTMRSSYAINKICWVELLHPLLEK